ncbi:uncharacterized protein CXorf65 homolog isoform X2 [Scyliorhinus torazame]|uniref:uncharacterized protein CXorf65 homolog isoform X2 n=1 Tax=Scyliorhinus torazame TaxID=75743 RepID=UPI003B5C6DB3
MFVVLKYGDDESALLNIQCRIQVLLEYIRSQCRCSPEDEVDVCDLNGMVKHLTMFPALYASEILTAREVLILVKVERAKGCEAPNYIPLLRNSLIINPDFLARLPTGEDGNVELHRRRMKKSKKLLSSLMSSANSTQETSALH